VIAKAKWLEKYSQSYANPRSFVSAKVNSGFTTLALMDIDFVAYQIMVYKSEKIAPIPTKAMKLLKLEGFEVVEYGVRENPTIFEFIELYKEKRMSCPYLIDGLVLTADIELGTSVAFKMVLEEQIRSTKVVNVDWNISRYGRYVPVVVYEAIYIDGARFTRATGHNARHIQDWNLGRHTKIKILRSGDVIPQVKDVEIDASLVPIFPEEKYTWHWDGADIVLDDIEGNREVQIARILHFFKTLGVKRLGEKTAEKLHDAGFVLPENIVSATTSELVKVKGIGKKTADFFYQSIRTQLASVPPDRLIVASTTFQSGIGRKLLKQLFRRLPRILDMSSKEIEKVLKKDKLPGFGPARIKSVVDGIPAFRKYLDGFMKDEISVTIDNYLARLDKLEQTGYNEAISGKKFVLTGFMGYVDYELEDYIYENQGDFATTITSDVAAVISSGVVEISKKMLDASALNVPVLTIQEFALRFAVPLDRFQHDEDHDDE